MTLEEKKALVAKIREDYEGKDSDKDSLKNKREGMDIFEAPESEHSIILSDLNQFFQNILRKFASSIRNRIKDLPIGGQARVIGLEKVWKMLRDSQPALDKVDLN
jgi:hypothetical protein